MKKHVLLIATTLSIIFLNSLKGQTIELTFTGQDAETSEHVQLDSIFIRNITQETDTFLTWNDTTLTLDLLTGLPEEIIPDNSFELLQNYPNPFNDRTTFVIRVYQKDSFIITLCDIIGRQLAQFSCDLDQGAHLFTITASQNNFYLLNVVSSKKSQSIKLLNNNISGISQHRIDYIGFQPNAVSEKIIKGLRLSGFPYTLGDEMQYVGFASGYELPAIYDSPEANTLYTFHFEWPDTLICGQPFIDKRDGQTYQTVLIGEQCWMAENLNIGERIDGSENQQNNTEIEKYCYDNNEDNCSQFGGLYQWDELMGYDTNRYIQGICPEGWHIPTIDEWTMLIELLGGPDVAGDSLKTGGSSGFNALLAGRRTIDGLFDGLNNETSFWSTDRQEDPFAYLVTLTQGSPTVSLLPGDRNAGYSVRCVKGLAPIIKPNVVVIDTAVYTLVSDSVELSLGIYRYIYDPKRERELIILEDIILGTTDGGYIRKVQEMEDIPPHLTLQTTQATLEDVFQQAELDLSITADSSSTNAIQIKRIGIKDKRGEVNYYITDFDVVIMGDVDVDINNYTLSFIPDVKLKIKIKKGVVVKIEFSCGLLTEHSIEVEVVVANEVNLMVGGSLLPSGAIPIGTFYFQLGPIPVIGALAFNLAWSTNLSYEDQNTETMAYFNTNSVTAGFLYENGIWTDIQDSYHEEGFDFVSSELHSGQIGFSVGPELFLMLYGIAGPYVNVGPELNLVCQVTSPPLNKDAEFSVGANVNAGVKVEIFGWTLAKYEIQFPIFEDLSLWRLPEEVEMTSGNNQAAAPGQPLSDPIIIRVADNYGNGFPYIPVHFVVTQGGGNLSEYEVLTDFDGYAQTLWTLGPEVGTNLMTASVQKADGTHVTGSPMEFSAVALGGLATVTTAPVTEIAETTATCGGDVLSDGGFPVTEKGVCWSTSSEPTLDDEFTVDGSGLGTFVSYLTGLSINTLYYVRAYATNSAGTSFGNELSFTSGQSITLPVVTTSEVTDITDTTATSGGNVTSDGGDAVTAKGVCWSTIQNPTLADNYTVDGTGIGSYVSYLTNLDPGTIYYVRAYATNSIGTSYGNEVQFTTTGVGAPGEPCPGTPTVLYEGITYNTVQIGTQCWLKENLNVGTRINGDQNQQNNGIVEKYCYNDLESNCDIYGGLYEWDEVMQYVTTEGTQGICPDGWHIPTDAEWTMLTDYLGGESVAGGKMKEAGLTHWASPNTGATNESGFTALPGGILQDGGYFNGLAINAYFWSSSQYDAANAWDRVLTSYGEYVYRLSNYKTYGFSARCVQD